MNSVCWVIKGVCNYIFIVAWRKGICQQMTVLSFRDPTSKPNTFQLPLVSTSYLEHCTEVVSRSNVIYFLFPKHFLYIWTSSPCQPISPALFLSFPRHNYLKSLCPFLRHLITKYSSRQCFKFVSGCMISCFLTAISPLVKCITKQHKYIYKKYIHIYM